MDFRMKYICLGYIAIIYKLTGRPITCKLTFLIIGTSIIGKSLQQYAMGSFKHPAFLLYCIVLLIDFIQTKKCW